MSFSWIAEKKFVTVLCTICNSASAVLMGCSAVTEDMSFAADKTEKEIIAFHATVFLKENLLTEKD